MMCQTSSVRAAWPLLVALALAPGCGGDDPESWPPERPRIDEVTFVGQSPQDSLGLVFSIAFVDADGDLGAGRLTLSINGGEVGAIALTDLFAAQTPALDADATSGDLEVLVRLDAEPDAGQQLTVGFRLEDGAGHTSNEPTTTLDVR